jgi:peptide deformylase
MANDLFALAIRHEADQIDEKIFFEAFDPKAAAAPTRRKNPS